METDWKSRYRVAAGRQQWCGWHMTWRADQGEGVQVRKEFGGELPGGVKDTTMVRAHVPGATLAPAPNRQGHRGLEVL